MIIRVPPKITNRNSIIKYVEIDLWGWLKELSTGLLKINFQQTYRLFQLVLNIYLQYDNRFSFYLQFLNL